MSCHTLPATWWRRQVLYVSQSRVTLDGTPAEFWAKQSRFTCVPKSERQRQRQFEKTKEKDAKGEVGEKQEEQKEQKGPEEGKREEAPVVPAGATTMAHAVALATQFGVPSSCFDKPWQDLSGGECQRCLLAIAFALRPRVLLLDEPTSACDPASVKAIEAAAVTSGAAIVWVTHDDAQAERVAHRHLVLRREKQVGGEDGEEGQLEQQQQRV